MHDEHVVGHHLYIPNIHVSTIHTQFHFPLILKESDGSDKPGQILNPRAWEWV